MAAPWDLPIAIARAALAVPVRGVRLAGDVVGLVEDLTSAVERLTRLLDVVESVPPRVVAVLDQVEAVPPRVVAVLDQVEPVVPRVEQVVATAAKHTRAAGAAIGQVQQLLGEVQQLRGSVGALLRDAEPLARALTEVDPAAARSLASVLADLDVVLSAMVRLDLLDRVEAEVLPAVSSLEGLVPVVDRLSVVVDDLNAQVTEVGGMLGGIPGAGRLLKRGDARKSVEQR